MRYTATYQFDGRGWVCQFTEPDIATFGRTLAAAKDHARSLLAVHLELPDLTAAGVEIADEVRLPAGVQVELAALSDQRAEANRLRREVAQGTRRAVASLRGAGLSTRDVGTLLGISGARVGQLNDGESVDATPEFEIQYTRVKRVRKLGESINDEGSPR